MRAMALTRPSSGTVEAVDFDLGLPGPWEVSVRVLACGVCRTDLHIVDGDLSDATIPIVPGHEIVGRIEHVGEQVKIAPVRGIGSRAGPVVAPEVKNWRRICGRSRHDTSGSLSP